MSRYCRVRVVVSFPARLQIECQNGRFALVIVRKLRLEKGLSQEQLAHMAGISTRTLQRIERGANASPETLKCVASVLETDFENLWKEQQMPTEEQPKLPRLSAEEKEAMEYVRDIKAFYMHLFVFAVVITGLTIINLFFTPGYFWRCYGPRLAGARCLPFGDD